MMAPHLGGRPGSSRRVRLVPVRQSKPQLVPYQGASGAGHHGVPPGVEEAAASSDSAAPARSGKAWEPAEEVP